MVRSKRFAVGLFASALVTAGIGAIVSSRAPAEEAVVAADCVDCGTTKIPILRTPDPAVNLASIEVARAKGEQIQQGYMEEARQRALERYNTWHGTQTQVPESVDREQRELFDAVARIFDRDVPAPEGRLKEFARYLGDEPEFKVFGWRVGILSVTPNDNGWLATVRVRPRLTYKDRERPVFTPRATLETWQIAEDGTAAVVDVRGEGAHFITVD